MPIPVIAYVGAAALAGYLLLRKKPSIKLRGAESPPPPPPPILPPPAPGQAPPPGFVALPSGALTQAISFGTNGFTAASEASQLNNAGFSQPGAILVGDCFTVDIGAAGFEVQGIPSGNVLFKCVDPMDGSTGIKGTPVDPRLPPGSPDMIVPKAAITGSGDC
jgi:hypothetical protein